MTDGNRTGRLKRIGIGLLMVPVLAWVLFFNSWLQWEAFEDWRELWRWLFGSE